MYLLTETSPTIVHSPTKYTLQNWPPLSCIFISPSLWDHWLDYKTSKNCIFLKLSLDSTFPSKLLPISLLPFITKLLRELALFGVFTSSSPIFPWAPSHQVLILITFRQTTVVKTTPGLFAAKPSGMFLRLLALQLLRTTHLATPFHMLSFLWLMVTASFSLGPLLSDKPLLLVSPTSNFGIPCRLCLRLLLYLDSLFWWFNYIVMTAKYSIKHSIPGPFSASLTSPLRCPLVISNSTRPKLNSWLLYWKPSAVLPILGSSTLSFQYLRPKFLESSLTSFFLSHPHLHTIKFCQLYLQNISGSNHFSPAHHCCPGPGLHHFLGFCRSLWMSLPAPPTPVISSPRFSAL